MNDLRRGIGFGATLALVVGNLVGSGIYLLPATLAPLGWNQLVGWGITIIGALALALVFARLAARLPLAGGPFVYVETAFGPFAGFITAWAYWTMLWVGNGAVAVAVVSSLALIFPRIGTTPGLPALLTVVCVWLLTLVNIRGVRLAGRVQAVTTVLKLMPLVLLIALALWLMLRGVPRVAMPPVPLSAGATATAVGLTFWGFLGLESATVPADKVEDAARVVPRATMVGVVLTGLVYVGISCSFAFYMPAVSAAASPAPVADFLGRFISGPIAPVVALFAAISAFGTLNGFILLQGEMPWAMARAGVFPAWLGKESRRGTPIRAHVVSSGLLSAVTLLNYQRGMSDLFAFIATASIAAGMLAYLLSMGAGLKLLHQQQLARSAALIGGCFICWATWGLGSDAVMIGAALVAIGVPVYWSVRRAAPAP